MRKVLVFFLCYLGCLGNPIPEPPEVFVFNYKGRVDSYTSANKDLVARWTVSGTLTQKRHSSNVTVVQLSDIKTGIYNGPKDKFKDVQQSLPEEAKILEQPFAISLSDDDELILNLKKNEPKWSINMKRGLMNLLNFEYEHPQVLPDGNLEFQSPSELTYLRHTLYGDCYVTYNRTLTTPEEFKYEYTLDGSNCTKNPIDSTIFTNLKGPSMREKIKFTHKKFLTVTKGPQFFSGKDLVAKTRISFKNCPSCEHTQEVDQEQSLSYVNEYYTEEVPDVSEYTEKRHPMFAPEIERDFTSGRDVTKLSSAEVVQRFINMYYNFQNRTFIYEIPEVYHVKDEDLVEDMFSLLMDTDVEGLKAVEKAIMELGDKLENDYDIEFFFLSLVSYIGTNDTTEYLLKYLQDVDKTGAFISRILLTFPRYIFHYSDDKLIEFEALSKTKHIVENKVTKKAAMFGFSTGIGLACRKNAISKKLKQQYIDMFNQRFLESETYVERMNNLLALINMGECLDFDFMTGITTNSSESSHLRLLALTGFKEYLENTDQHDKLFSTYWPLVQKKSEPFEVRIAALELLLNDDILTDQFANIAGKYSGELVEPGDRQIANYILTHLHSGKLGLHEDLQTIKDFNLHRYPKSFATGLYNFQYQDSEFNVGSYLKTQVITEPKNNIVNFVQFSFNSFAMGYDFGTYSIYINMHGLCNDVYLDLLFKRDSNPSVPELIKLLKDYNFNVGTLSKRAHIDIVVFVDNVAVYAQHYLEINKEIARSLLIDFEDMFQNFRYLQFPVVNTLQMPSDLGTLLTLTASMQNVAKYNDEKQFRNSWTHEIWMEIYNPILNTHIATFKYDNVEIYAHLNFTVLSTAPPKVTWYNSKNGLGITWSSNMGTAINQRYCRECEPFYEMPTSAVKFTELLGFERIVQAWKYTDMPGNFITEIKDFYENNKHLINADANSYAYPVLFIANLIHYKLCVENSIARGTITITPSSTEDDITKSTLLVHPRIRYQNEFDEYQYIDVYILNQVENLNDELLSVFNMTATVLLNPDDVIQEDNSTYVSRDMYLSLLHKGMDNSTNFKVCGYGFRYFPQKISDRLSLEQYDPANSEMIFYFLNDPNLLDIGCNEDESDAPYTLNVTEKYSSINKETILQNQQSLKDFQQCKKDSKDLKYTAPTKECKRSSNRFTEYGKYELYLEGIHHLEKENVTIFKTEQPIIEYSRHGDDIVDIKFRLDLKQEENNVYNKSVYYPGHLPNPMRQGYNMDDTAFSFRARSSCTITPTKIQQFTGKLIANDKKKWLAFAECYNLTRRALLGRTIDDKHIGFTFYLNDKVVEGTVVDGKAHITYNGQPLTKYLHTRDFQLMVHFLDDNVTYVRDITTNAEFYYNTEYIAVKIDSLYLNMLCGVCN